MINKSQINFYYTGSCDPNYFIECRIAYWLWRTLPIIVLTVGTFGNIINIIILSAKTLRKYSTSVFLLLLAVSDLIVLWLSLLPETVFSITRFRLDDEWEGFCRLRLWLAYTSGGFSVWMLVLLTIERILLTRAPLYSTGKLTPRNALICSAIVLLIVASLNTHTIYGFRIYNIVKGGNYMRNASIGDDDELPCHFVSSEYRHFFEENWSIILFVCFVLLPAFIIIIGNISIFVSVGTYRKRLTKVAPAGRFNLIAVEKAKSARKILFFLSIMYLITTMPWSIYYVIKGKLISVSPKGEARWQLVTVIVSVLLWCNFSFNVFFYYVSGTLFKQEWSRLTKMITCKIKFTRNSEEYNVWTV